ncbi:MAG: efflux RND transporter periplasmic adaptor subunit [Desulfobacterales bacterium]|nr:efflux RND transporter periplasmic adaptor subunit [Desulfobacterales bacterium]
MKQRAKHLLMKTLVFLTMVIVCISISLFYFSSGQTTGADLSAEGGGTELLPVNEKFEARGVPVTVIDVTPNAYPSRVKVYGQTKSLWHTTVRSQVTGRVERVFNIFRKGHIVGRGDVLVNINDSRYKAGFAHADQALSLAKLELLKEKQEVRQASANWKSSGLKGEPGSPLVLRTPQLELAKKSLATAQADLSSAVVDLDFCKITAPFKGIIVDRLVSPGDTVSVGEPIAVIAGIDTMEISLGLDAGQLALLGRDLKAAQGRVVDEAAGVEYGTGHLKDSRTIDPQTRLRKILCIIKNPMELDPPLLSGTFVTVSISGRPRQNLLRMPISALTRKGLVWIVEKDNTLESFDASALFYDSDHVFVPAPKEKNYPLKVAVFPNAAFVTGMKVMPAVLGQGV